MFTHVYTLILRSAGTYTVKIDNAEVESGDLENDWDFLLPKKIQVMQCVIELKHNKPSNEKTWNEWRKYYLEKQLTTAFFGL